MGMRVWFLAWDFNGNFLCVPNLWFDCFFKKIRSERFYGKKYGLVPCIHILEVFFSKTKAITGWGFQVLLFNSSSFTAYYTTLLEKFRKKGAKKSVKRKCRKCTWKETLVNDSVDIILENEHTEQSCYWLTNVKNVKNGIYYDQVVNKMKERCKTREENFPFDITKTREKLKKCINICLEAAMKIKTKSGIQKFQVEKNCQI